MQDERYNDPEFLDNETRRVQEESVHSSRRALNRLNEAAGIAEDNLNRMNSQSEQLYHMEKGLEETKHTAKVV
jgi:synaptosomal-associated protein 29